MMVHILFRMAFRAITHHVIRSLLTLLGIVIGITGIITISAVGKGTQKKARDQHLAYGSKSIHVRSGNFMSFQKKPPKPITLNDMNNILAQCPAVQSICPLQGMQDGEAKIEYEGNQTSASIEPANEQ